jgi:hypothetical protein
MLQSESACVVRWRGWFSLRSDDSYQVSEPSHTVAFEVVSGGNAFGPLALAVCRRQVGERASGCQWWGVQHPNI